MDATLRRRLGRTAVAAALAATVAVAVALVGFSESFAVGAAAGVWLALSLLALGPWNPVG